MISSALCFKQGAFDGLRDMTSQPAGQSQLPQALQLRWWAPHRAALQWALKREVWMTTQKQWVSWTRMCDDTSESEGQTVCKIPHPGSSLGRGTSARGGQQTLRLQAFLPEKQFPLLSLIISFGGTCFAFLLLPLEKVNVLIKWYFILYVYKKQCEPKAWVRKACLQISTLFWDNKETMPSSCPFPPRTANADIMGTLWDITVLVLYLK